MRASLCTCVFSFPVLSSALQKVFDFSGLLAYVLVGYPSVESA